MNGNDLISVFCKHLFMHSSYQLPLPFFKTALLNKICMYVCKHLQFQKLLEPATSGCRIVYCNSHDVQPFFEDIRK